MRLASGTRLGPFEIVGALGAGGMGEVYRARDVNLGREVALKILPGAYADDRDWRRRFDREAKLLASLSHPNLATVHWSDAESDTPFFVMELVPGPTLADRLRAGSLPLAEALGVLRQICAGLEAAHDAGIVHRDLKPGNIKITPDGVVKILDFGLAKTAMVETGDPASAETAVVPPTQAGAIIGTAPYMSPEQATGRPVDRRTDLWALGCVGYEMLTGRRTFQAATDAESIAAVLRADPAWDAVPPAVPARLRDVLRQCLQKDPARRLRDARDVRLAIEDLQSSIDRPSAAETTEALGGAPPVSTRRTSLALVTAWLVAGAAVLGAAALWWTTRHAAGPAAPQWTYFTQLTDLIGVEDDPVIAPDGRTIAYSRLAGERAAIFVQRVGGHAPMLVASGTASALHHPAFSPDGSQIAYHERDNDGGIFIVGATGESARRLTDFGFHPSWSPDGKRIVFATEEAAEGVSRFTVSSLWTVDVGGGAPVKIYSGDAVQPAWSPHGDRIAFMASPTNGQRDLMTMPAAGGAVVAVTNDTPIDLNPAWAPDGRFLYFASDRGGFVNLWRSAIEESTGRPTGEPELVTGGVVATADRPSLSTDGARLVFRSRTLSQNPYAAPFDAAAEALGASEPLLERTGILRVTGAASDGPWLALSNQGEAQEDVFAARSDGSELRRLTDDAFRDRSPTISADGRVVTFYSNRGGGGGLDIWTIKIDGSGLTRVSALPSSDLNFPQFDPSGRRIVASTLRAHRVLLFDLSKPLPITEPEELPDIAAAGGWLVAGPWSPDGRWILGPILNDAGRILGLGVYDLSARHARPLAGAENLTSGSWLPDSRRIVSCQGPTIVTIDMVSGRRTAVRGTPPTGTAGICTLSRDGRSLYLTVQRTEADIWMVEPARGR